MSLFFLFPLSCSILFCFFLSVLSFVWGFTLLSLRCPPIRFFATGAAHMLFTMESNFGDLANRRVLDLGCGCGMLSIGAAMFDCGQVVAIDVDTDALATAVQNAEEFELNIDFLQADLGPGIPSILSPGSFDTVVMNPPFGTKNNAGIDMVFLRRAWQLSSGAVYSLHKTTTREVGSQIMFRRILG